MKKAKMIGLMAGIMALAVGAGATYAWFTSTVGLPEMQVGTAKIEIFSETVVEDLTGKLPGEMIGFENWDLENKSTRGSVVQFTIEGLDIQPNQGQNFEAGRKDKILAWMNDPANDCFAINVAAGDNATYQEGTALYLWLNEYDAEDGSGQLDNQSFYMTMKLAEILGGNVSEAISDDLDNQVDHGEEQESTLTFKCAAYAVQGTQAAVEDIFGGTVAEGLIRNGAPLQ